MEHANLTMQAQTGTVSELDSPSGVRLRRMSPADVDNLAELWIRSYPTSITEQETVASVRADLLATLSGSYGPFLHEASATAVNDADEVIGSIQTLADTEWERTPRGPFIVDLFVAPEARRSGLGRSLLMWSMRELTLAGHQEVGLRVLRDNHSAIALYESAGFHKWTAPDT